MICDIGEWRLSLISVMARSKKNRLVIIILILAALFLIIARTTLLFVHQKKKAPPSHNAVPATPPAHRDMPRKEGLLEGPWTASNRFQEPYARVGLATVVDLAGKTCCESLWLRCVREK
jgi:hypothetical protein